MSTLHHHPEAESLRSRPRDCEAAPASGGGAPREVKEAVRGWLLVFCLLLLFWQPLSLALVASRALDALPVVGLPLALLLAGRVLVAASGIAAGLALVGRRPGAVALAKTALVLSAGMDAIVYLTPYFPNNRAPGETTLYVAASLIYSGLWLAYLVRSDRVRRIYQPRDAATEGTKLKNPDLRQS